MKGGRKEAKRRAKEERMQEKRAKEEKVEEERRKEKGSSKERWLHQKTARPHQNLRSDADERDEMRYYPT